MWRQESTKKKTQFFFTHFENSFSFLFWLNLAILNLARKKEVEGEKKKKTWCQ
jgi:hypothetical protein